MTAKQIPPENSRILNKIGFLWLMWFCWKPFCQGLVSWFMSTLFILLLCVCQKLAPFFCSKKKKLLCQAACRKPTISCWVEPKKNVIHSFLLKWMILQTICHVWMVQLYEWCLLGTSHGNYFPWMSIFHLDDVFCLCMNWHLEELKRFPCCYLWARCP